MNKVLNKQRLGVHTQDAPMLATSLGWRNRPVASQLVDRLSNTTPAVKMTSRSSVTFMGTFRDSDEDGQHRV